MAAQSLPSPVSLLAAPIADEAPRNCDQPAMRPASRAQRRESPPPGVPNVIEFLAQRNQRIQGLEIRQTRTNELGELRSHLARTGMPSPQPFPAAARHSLPTMGCVTFDYNGTKLSMICFKNGQVYHLITADKANFPAHCSQRPQSFACNQQAFKLWTEGDQVLILCTEGTLEDIAGCK